ncbi:MAG TPA: hypothetical protein VGG44_04355 [Tepidisphaeraceae bacterium]|jgi:hypothetical protein
MLARISLPAGFILFGVLTFGCTDQHPAATSSAAPVTPSSAVVESHPHHSQPAAAEPTESQTDPDEASLLARKTSEYAQNVTPLLSQSSAPATRPSIVEWAEPRQHPASAGNSQPADHELEANRGASLAADHLKEDSTVPLILPESADRIPPAAPRAQAASPVAMQTDAYEVSLQKLVTDYPRDLGNQLDYQLLRFVRDEPTPELSNVSQLSDEDRDILLALMDGLNNFRAAVRNDGNLMLNRKIEPLLEMADRLRSEAQLSIPTVAFCTRVSRFGVYDPMPSSRFPAGRNNDLIVYCEVANFNSVQGSDRMWRTRLQQEMVLYTEAGLAVWPERPSPAVIPDESRDRRHDFFIPTRVRLPSSLAAGKYVLKITLTDQESNRIVEANAPLELMSPTPPTDAAVPAADQTQLPLPALSP